MFLSHPQFNLNKMIQHFYQPKSHLQISLNQQLQAITQWVRHYRNDQVHEVNKILVAVGKRLNDLTYNKNYNQQSNPHWIVVMKSLMLVHHLLCIGINGNVFEELLQTANESLHRLQYDNLIQIQKLQKLSDSKPSSTSTPSLPKAHFTHHTTLQKLLQPYHHYLTRRCQMLPKTFNQQGKCHYLINLLNCACNCNEVIYIFARYKHFDKFGLMGQFNFIMAKDVCQLYDLLRNYLSEGEKRRREGGGKLDVYVGNLCQNFVIVSDVDDLLLSLHEKLFHIFYNKYHYLKVERHIPDWIDLDANYQPLNHSKSNMSGKSNSTLLSCSLGKSTKKTLALEDTMTSLNSSQKHADDQRVEKSLQLIGDMERFLEVFEEVVV